LHSTKSENVIQQQSLFIYMWNISAKTAWYFNFCIFTNSNLYEYKIHSYMGQWLHKSSIRVQRLYIRRQSKFVEWFNRTSGLLGRRIIGRTPYILADLTKWIMWWIVINNAPSPTYLAFRYTYRVTSIIQSTSKIHDT